MKTENELIAEFMGLEKSRDVWEKGEYAYTMKYPDCFNKWVIPSNMKFQTSWDWLMPVVEKIAKLHSSKFHYDPVEMAKGVFPEDNDYMDVICLPVSTPISQVYKSVVEFIKFYNS